MLSKRNLHGRWITFTGASEHVEPTPPPHPPPPPPPPILAQQFCFCLKPQKDNESVIDALCCSFSNTLCSAAVSPSSISLLCLSMALPVVVFLLALTSLGAASAPDCKDLVKPFMPEDPKLVFGKWVYVMGAGDPKPYHKALESLKSSWIDLSPTSDSQIVTLRWGDHCFNRCISGEVNATVSGLATTFRKNLSDHKGHILQTCSDCLLWTDTFRNGDVTGRYILQFTRTGKMDPKDAEIFKKQVGCLNLPENFYSYDGKTELCPDDKESTE